MSQAIVVQVGQCGNQIGSQFWESAVKEHSFSNSAGDDAMATFFSFKDQRNPFHNLRARGIMIDMEEKVLGRSQPGGTQLFDPDQIISDCSGSGNNWAVGYKHYGALHRETIMNSIRRQAEMCDCLQSFFLIHSLGGGTGSGLGSYILENIGDHYPEVNKFSYCVFPSVNDDVITSPYNRYYFVIYPSVLSLSKLSKYTDVIVPFDNQKLFSFANGVRVTTLII